MPVANFTPSVSSSGTSAVFLAGTAGTIGVRVGQIDGSVAVYFSPSNPAVAATFSGSIAAVPTSGSGSALYDETADAVRVLISGSHSAASLQIKGITESIAVHIGSTAGTMGVRVGQVDGSIAVYFSPANPAVSATFGGTMATYFDQSNPAVTAYTVDGATKRALRGNSDGAIKVYDIADGSIVVRSITASVAVHLLSTNGTIGVNVQRINETVAVYLQNTAGTIRVGDIPGSMGVYFSPSLPTIKGINDSIAVHLLSTNGTIAVNVQRINETVAVYLQNTAGTIGVRVGQVDGTVAVYFSQSKPIVLADEQGTASIFTVSGSTSGVSVSGVTLIAPSANYSFKVYAYSIQTTGIVSCVAKFTNGAGTGPTEFWRPLVTANQTSSVPIGANLSTGGGGKPLFTTGVSTTLALVLDTATLVHYSVAYTKESA